MKITNNPFYRGMAAGALAVSLLATGALAGYKAAHGTTVLSDRAHVNKLEYLESLIDQYYLNDKDEEKLAEGLYAGLIAGLDDPYAAYFTADQYEEFSMNTEGTYVGIGIVMAKNPEGGVKVISCYEGSPADNAGLKEDDIISAVDGEDITDKTTSQVADMIKNRKGEEATLAVHREGTEETLEITVDIDEVILPYVFHEMLDDHVGYIRIIEFAGVAFDQYQEAFKDLKKQGMEKMVVDLRGNPGGLLTSVCDILSQILPEGLIVYTEDKYGKKEENFSRGEHILDIPLAVLVNETSASASEIFAGAIKDYEAGTIVGTTTYGKGVVQTIRPLADGSAVKFTVSKYFTPKGSNIDKVGIEPDVEVKLDPSLLNKEEITREEDNQLQKALEILREEQ